MTTFVRLMLSVAFVSCISACASQPAPVDTGNADAQRSRAEKAQSELGDAVSRQKESEKRQ